MQLNGAESMKNYKNMIDKKIIAQGVAEAEKEAQQKQIDRVKGIVQTILEKIKTKKEIEETAREERKLLEKDLDDLKSGRLDNIEERHSKDPKARETSVIVVHKIEKEFIPYYPWRSPWEVTIKREYVPTITSIWDAQCLSCSDPVSVTYSSTNDRNTIYMMTAQGTDFQNFSKGSYEIGDQIINL